MLRKKTGKVAIVLACVLTLLAPYTTVFAGLTKADTTANLQSVIMHEGGEEASGTLTEEQKEIYDEMPHGYEVGDTLICKIIEEGDYDFSNAFYCLNAMKSFPGATSTGFTSLEYKNVADFKDSNNSEVKSLHLSTSYSEDNALWTSNYKALNWIFENSYLRKQTPEQKDDYLAKAFAGYEYGVDAVKAYLTDDDIDVVQQYAIWYFTNRDTEKFDVTTLPAITISGFSEDGSTYEGSYRDVTGSNLRQEMANHLYQYLINEAMKGNETTQNTYPSLGRNDAVLSENDNYYIAGPFNIKAGTVAATEYSIKLLDDSNKEIPRNQYEVLLEGESNFTNKNINEIFDTNYYIYLPKTNGSITNINLELSYSNFDTSSTFCNNKITYV